MSEQPAGEIVLYQRGGAPAIDVRLDDDTVWLSQQQLADLFQTSRSDVVEHIANIYGEGELEQGATCREFRQVRADGSRQVLDLYATSVDYDPGAEASVWFFKTVQNKLHYAAHGQTAAEVIARRADAGKPFMGLLTFSGRQPTKAELGNAENYLDENELKRLNALVSAYFDAAEFRAMNHEPTYMKDWLRHLTQLITAMGGKTLHRAGKVSHEDALAHAEAEYARFRTRLAAQPSEVEAVFLETVKKAQRKIEGKKK